MKTVQQTNVELTFECINCRIIATEKMHPIQAMAVQAMGGCCVNCCNDAEHYYATQEYMAFEEAEEDGLY